MLNSPRSCARLRMLSVNGPWNMPGNKVKISKCILFFVPLSLCVTIASLPLTGKSIRSLLSMSWSQTLQTGDLHDQMTILIGSAIRLLCGEAGVFVVSNEAFDPQSSHEYTLYRLNPAVLPLLLKSIEESGRRPNSTCILVRNKLSSKVVDLLCQDE